MTLWNQFQTDAYAGMIAETVAMSGHNGNGINAYLARPLGSGPFPGVVLIPHMPGWDELFREITRRFANHGYAAICPNIFYRFGHGTPDEIAAKARGAGGVPDDIVVGDLSGAAQYLRSQAYSSGKVGIIGTCSGGRHAYLTACRTPGWDALVNCWGGRVVAAPSDLTPAQPVAPIDYTKDLHCPILGLFGNDDQSPSPDHVNQLEAALKTHRKNYEFHRYDGAGHAFWYYDRAAYRPQQAMDAWQKTFEFLGKHLQS